MRSLNLAFLLILGVASGASAQIDSARGGAVTTMAKNPTTYTSIASLLSYNSTASIR